MDPGVLIERYVPEEILRGIAKQLELPSREPNKPEIIESIVKKIGPEKAWQLLDEHFEVGRGSLYWYKLDNSDLNKKTIEQKIKSKTRI